MTISLRISEESRLRNRNNCTADGAEEDKQSEVKVVILTLIYLLIIYRTSEMNERANKEQENKILEEQKMYKKLINNYPKQNKSK